MKTILKLSVMACAIFLLIAMKSNRKRVVFFGDYITQGGVNASISV